MEKADLAYLIGSLRDGCFTVDEKQKAYRIRIYQKSRAWLEKISDMLRKAFLKEPTFYLDKRRNVWCLTFSSKNAICELLSLSGYTFDQMIWLTPKWIYNEDLQIKAAYIRGFFDAEGSIETNNVRIYIAQANKEVLEELRELLKEFGINALQIHGSYIKKGTRTKMYALLIHSKKRVLDFYAKIGSYHPDKISRFNRLQIPH